MKRALVIISLLIVVFWSNSCNSQSIVGIWKVKRAYTCSYKMWSQIKDESNRVFFEFRKNGSYDTRNSSLRYGNYTLDENANPRRFILNEDGGRQTFGIYKLQEGKLIFRLSEKGFPGDFEIEENCSEDLAEIEREK